MNVTDTVFLARVGIVELAAVVLADTLYEMAVLLTFAVRWLSPFVTNSLMQSDEVAAAVDSFLQVIALGTIFRSANLAYCALFVGVSRSRVLFIATAVLAGTNLVMDYGLILGHFGLPCMGIRGAAWGSVVAEIATFVFLTAYIARVRFFRRYRLFRMGRWNPTLIRRLMSISWPVSLQALLEGVRWFVFFLILEQLGEAALAASNIVYCCYCLFLIPTEGISETVCSTVSNMIGGGQSRKIALLIRKAISPDYLVTLPFVIMTLAFPTPVLSLFSDDPLTVQACVNSVRVIGLAMLIVIPAQMWFVAVSGTGDTGAAFVIELILSAGIILSCYAAAFSLNLPLEFVWMSIPVGWVLCLALSYGWLESERWARVLI